MKIVRIIASLFVALLTVPVYLLAAQIVSGLVIGVVCICIGCANMANPVAFFREHTVLIVVAAMISLFIAFVMSWITGVKMYRVLQRRAQS